MYNFFNTSPKIPYNVQGIHHDIVNLWTFCVYSFINYLHHANFATYHRLAIWALKQNGKKVQGAASCHLVS